MINKNRKFTKLEEILVYVSITLFVITCYLLIIELNSIIDSHDNNLFHINSITNSVGSRRAPEDGSIGLWFGKGDIYDDSSDYYIVHDTSEKYGEKLLSSKIGNTFTIKDKTYTIYDILYVKRDTALEDIQDLVLPGGDTAAIQVCVTGSNYYKIVISKTNTFNFNFSR